MTNNGRSDTIGDTNPLRELGALRPGDAVDAFGGDSLVAKTVFLCRETVSDETFQWRWTFMDDGSLIEASPDGYFRYDEHHVEKQGSPTYEEIVARDGALVRFEEHVRASESGRRPVHVTIGDKRYRITSTGTVAVQKTGPDPEPIPWRSFSSKSDDNVYFGMVDVADEARVVLGLWTTHLCLSFGRELGPTDVTAVYRK